MIKMKPEDLFKIEVENFTRGVESARGEVRRARVEWEAGEKALKEERDAARKELQEARHTIDGYNIRDGEQKRLIAQLEEEVATELKSCPVRFPREDGTVFSIKGTLLESVTNLINDTLLRDGHGPLHADQIHQILLTGEYHANNPAKEAPADA
jgi:hypothetical protein